MYFSRKHKKEGGLGGVRGTKRKRRMRATKWRRSRVCGRGIGGVAGRGSLWLVGRWEGCVSGVIGV